MRGGEGEEEEEEEGTARGDSVFMGLKLVQERTKNEEEESVVKEDTREVMIDSFPIDPLLVMSLLKNPKILLVEIENKILNI